MGSSLELIDDKAISGPAVFSEHQRFCLNDIHAWKLVSCEMKGG